MVKVEVVRMAKIETLAWKDGKPIAESVERPLSYPQKRLLSAIEANPGFSRSELSEILYLEMNPYHSLQKVRKMVKALERRGLVEFDVIHEGGRAGVPGVYMVGQKRETRAGYLGIFGWVGE